MYLSDDFELGKANRNNRAKYLARHGYDISNLIQAKLVHGNDVRNVNSIDMYKIINNVDGLITNDRYVLLGLTAADCFPVYFYDPKKAAVGIAHAGWRGTVKGIIQNAVNKMQSEFGSNPKNIIVGIGPGIRPRHYSIKLEIEKEFPDYAKENRQGITFVDLPKIITQQLLDEGIDKNNINDCGECTYCMSEKYFSHRRDQVDPLETMLAYITMV